MNGISFWKKAGNFVIPPRKGDMRTIITSRASFSLCHFIVMCSITTQPPGAWEEQAPADSRQGELVLNTCSGEARSHPSMLF